MPPQFSCVPLRSTSENCTVLPCFSDFGCFPTAHFLTFPYYGHAGEQYAFFRIPKLLITDSRFDGVSSDAKLLYGLLLDRMELSYRNGWVDDQNRVFIIFTVEEVMETLRCRSEKAVHLFAELDSKKGIGLIERKRQGLGKPAIIYVKNFAGDIS